MTSKPKVLLTPLEDITLFAPLVALGYWVHEQDDPPLVLWTGS